MDKNLERIKQIMAEEHKLRKLEAEVIENSTKNFNNINDLIVTAKKNAEDMKFCTSTIKELEQSNQQLVDLLLQKQTEMQILEEINQSLKGQLGHKMKAMEKQHERYLIEIERLRVMKRLSGVYLKRNSPSHKIEGVFSPTGEDGAEWRPFSLDTCKDNNTRHLQKKFRQFIGHSPNTEEWMRLIAPTCHILEHGGGIHPDL